ncbi:MAG TPA: succinyl-diaminopimelate desuccinylase [Kineosporiaceae bacterium]|nr:succinyl-diaminopimelate desuccinylase [Kineosporiaceae bacterium]
MTSARPLPRPAVELDLGADVVELTRALCDVESVSGNEGPLADAVEAALRRLPHLQVLRDGDAVVARTDLGRSERVILAGHLDTVPVAGNLPVRFEGSVEGDADGGALVGRGTADMKGGVAVQLRVAAALPSPTRDVTFVFYDNEEVDAARNGLGRLAGEHPEWIAGDLAVLLEPTAAGIEGGCNGTLRAQVTTRGLAAHSARWWRGRNAVHEAGRVLTRLQAYEPREVEVEGLVYREGLNAVLISGGVAGNVIPDECRIVVNYRFAPDKDAATASEHVREVFEGFEVEIVDAADGARPGLDRPAAAAFVEAIGAPATAKYGWTDVARFSALGVPAVNFGPGDPSVAHADDEHVPVAQLRACEQALLRWLG